MKSLLLDSHALIAYVGGSKRFGTKTTKLLNENNLYFSPVSIFELKLKELRRPGFVSPITQPLLQALGFEQMPFDSMSANQLLVLKTKDPFDMMLAAQAKAFGAKLITADLDILDSGLDFVVDLTD